MSKRKLTEIEVMKKLGINSWRNLSREKVIGFVQMYPQMDKEVFLKILDQIPNFVDESKIIVDSVVKTLEYEKNMSKDSKDVLMAMANNIANLLDKQEFSEEVQIKLIESLNKIIDEVNILDQRDRESSSESKKGILAVFGTVICTIGTILGIRYFNNKDVT